MATAPAATATTTIRGLPRPLARAMEAYAGRLDVDQIKEAHRLASEAHSGQTRASGASFVSHAVEVATILAQLRLDTASVAAGLIHDVVEDTAVDLTDVESRFGADVAAIVDGVTKIGRVRFRSHTEHQVENYRKLLLSMAQDARVILIKLAGSAAQHAHAGTPSAGQAAPYRSGDKRHLRPARAPARGGGHQVGARGSRLQVPGAGGLQGAQTEDPPAEAGARARDPRGEASFGGDPDRGGDPVRGDGPSQASLVHLQEDDRPTAAVRGDLRLDGPPGHYGLRTKLLRGPGHHPQPLDARAGPVSRLHRDAEVQHVSISTYDGIRAGWSPIRDSDPDGGDAPDSRAGNCSALAI